MVHLQQTPTALTDWAQEWQLVISIDKCCVLNLGIQLSAPHLFINNHKLCVVPQTHHLVIRVSDSQCPTAHVFDIASKAHRHDKLLKMLLLLESVLNFQRNPYNSDHTLHMLLHYLEE